MGDADPLPVVFFFSVIDLDGRGEDAGEGVGDTDPLPRPVPAFLPWGADLGAGGEASGEGDGEAVGGSSSAAFFFCLAASCAVVRPFDEVAVTRGPWSDSLTSDAVVSSSISVSRVMAGAFCWWTDAPQIVIYYDTTKREGEWGAPQRDRSGGATLGGWVALSGTSRRVPYGCQLYAVCRLVTRPAQQCRVVTRQGHRATASMRVPK